MRVRSLNVEIFNHKTQIYFKKNKYLILYFIIFSLIYFIYVYIKKQVNYKLLI